MVFKNIPDYLKELVPYKPGRQARDIKIFQKKIIKLSSNENPLGTSPIALKNLKKTVDDIHLYPDPMAYDLSSKLSELYKVFPENLVIGHGSESLLSHIAKVFINPGDEILTSEDTFAGFYVAARSSGAKLVMTPLNRNYRYDVKSMRKKINKKTKIIYIANPNNPTGTYITKKEFDYLMQGVSDEILVILDEAYFEYTYKLKDYPDSMHYRYDNVITLRTFSKAYGLAGMRVGYGMAHKKFIDYIKRVKLPFEPSILAQAAAVGGLNDEKFLMQTIKNNEKSYHYVAKFLDKLKIKYIKSVANFITIDFKSAKKAENVFQELNKNGIIVRDLKSKRLEKFLRVSLGEFKDMQYFCKTLGKILGK
jgi:histidinol-phosphate aminotransferase